MEEHNLSAGAKALMPMQSKALAPDEIGAFFDGRVPWRILAIPFGGPIPSPTSPRGVDLDGQYFSERTDIYGPFAALKATRERLVDWHHSLNPIGGRGGDPTGRMNGVVLGKAVLDPEPDDDGHWVDFWVQQGQARLASVRRLVERGAQLFGSAQPTHPDHTRVDPATGEITRFPFLLETITTSPQNTLSVVRPKALLDDLDTAEIAVSGALRDLLTELDVVGSELPFRFRGHGGGVAVKADSGLSPEGARALDDALASWRAIPDALRQSHQGTNE